MIRLLSFSVPCPNLALLHRQILLLSNTWEKILGAPHCPTVRGSTFRRTEAFRCVLMVCTHIPLLSSVIFPMTYLFWTGSGIPRNRREHLHSWIIFERWLECLKKLVWKAEIISVKAVASRHPHRALLLSVLPEQLLQDSRYQWRSFLHWRAKDQVPRAAPSLTVSLNGRHRFSMRRAPLSKIPPRSLFFRPITGISLTLSW